MPAKHTTTYQSPFSTEDLNNFRKQGDPLADEVIDVFAEQYGSSIQELAEKLENMIRMPTDGDVIAMAKQVFPDNEQIQKALEKYFTQAVKLPEWLDTDKLKHGGYVFRDHMFSSFMVLGCASLPICYVCRPDVKVLSYTRRLIDDAPKRLVETAQMVVDVMGEGGLTVKDNELAGKGVQSTLKIRLIHAAIRHLMLNKEKILAAHSHNNDINPKNFLLAYIYDEVQDQCKWYGESKPDVWNIDQDGVPINKEALAETLLTFSYLILSGLNKIGIKLPSQQQQAYLHAWNVAGYLLGVDEAFLKEFDTFEKVDVIYTQIMLRRRGKTTDGILLQQSLLEVFADNGARLIPFGRLLHVRRLARLVTSKLIAQQAYADLGLKLSLYDRIVRFFMWIGIRVFGWLVSKGWFRKISDYVFAKIAQSLWDWRADFSNAETQVAEKHKNHKHDKTGVCNPLIIPHQLIATSHLADQYDSKANT